MKRSLANTPQSLMFPQLQAVMILNTVLLHVLYFPDGKLQCCVVSDTAPHQCSCASLLIQEVACAAFFGCIHIKVYLCSRNISIQSAVSLLLFHMAVKEERLVGLRIPESCEEETWGMQMPGKVIQTLSAQHSLLCQSLGLRAPLVSSQRQTLRLPYQTEWKERWAPPSFPTTDNELGRMICSDSTKSVVNVQVG